ncbi:PGF-CTERM-anchored ABC transporter substrate-binding protein [Halorussus salilacus]|uniref:PGF-CTERM-anchored ABC transporter substrate-binding protein n=1 Tax=Halorussus salilacus TaxID=2953750 RepID=UPI00209DC353|nr:PGF-CTERM-anchored ABC transporter substrate-binding protein [Halorussus salilacus]USZ68601.1 PGF-CTERM-anchored ABC transporter substrate-binding protein [Halorussus salilacus]
MKTKVTSVLAVLMLLTAGVAPVAAASGTSATQAECSFPATHTDATGTEVTVEESPERVTTLSPSAAQTMWELGAEEQVVGLTQYALYLDGADSRTNVSAAGNQTVSVEKVVSTDPDLVLAPNVIPNETVERLRDAGLTVYKTRFATSLDDIYAKTERIGELTGNCEAADETVASMRDRVETVEEAVENSESPRVFVSVGGGYTAGQGTFVSNMVEVAGGTNIAVEANVSGYKQISEEVIVEQDPEWIVQLGAYGVYPQTDAYNATTAVQNDQVTTVTNENISQPAPRVVNAIVQMAQAFHPEAYEEANATAETTTTTEATTTDEPTTTDATTDEPTTTEATTDEGAMAEETDTTTGASSDSSSDVPGFGVPAALAALAGAVLLARRY